MGKVLPFQDWRPLTAEEAARVPPGLRWVRVSRRPTQTPPEEDSGRVSAAERCQSVRGRQS